MSNLLAPNQKTSHNEHFTAIRIIRSLLIVLLLILPLLFPATGAQANTSFPPFVPDGTTNVLYLPMISTGSAGGGSTYRPSESVPKYNLLVDQTGIYHVSYEDLLDAGLDLYNVKASELAITNQGQAIPIYVHSNLAFGSGSCIEFYGEAIDSIYTHTNVYTLFADADYALRVNTDMQPVDPNATFEPEFLNTVSVNRDQLYAYNAPGDDPWFDTNMLTYNTLKTWEYPIEITNSNSNGVTATLSLTLWGAVELRQNPDHHYQVSINGTLLADKTFDGWVVEQKNFDIPAGVLQEGTNTIQITLPGDTGGIWDAINLDKYSITYPCTFKAQGDSSIFSSDGDAFQVREFSSSDIVAYRRNGESLTRYINIQVNQEDGTFTAALAGEENENDYYVYADPGLLSPKAIEPKRPHQDISSGEAEFIIISHPDFIENLTPLVQTRQAEGYTVEVVNLLDIYDQYSYGVIAPAAIKDYIRDAVSNKNTHYVLLVGGDSYDYFNNLGLGNYSFIPTYYMEIDAYTTFAPVDAWFADLDDDQIPDIALGRMPVRTSEELDILIAKTLAYADKDYEKTSVFAADKYFSSYSDELIATMPFDWGMDKVYLDDMEIDDARASLTAAMNNGVALVSYIGHSSSQSWSYYNLFTTADAATLTNANKPFVATEYGCLSAYFVDPSYTSMTHELLVGGNRGAAALIGSTTVGYAGSQSDFGNALMPELAKSGQTIGDAVLHAKETLYETYPFYKEIYLGYTIFGDPTLVVQP